MKPIYIPYTFIPEEVAEAGAACFGQMIVFQPSGLELPAQMVASEKKGWLDICVPITGDEGKMLSVINDYKQWADVHANGDGTRLDLHGQRKDTIPFFNESSIMRIREDIQRRIDGTDTVQEAMDPFFSARVFLHMAQEFDNKNYEIHQSVRQLDKMEHQLMKTLQGGEFNDDRMTKNTYRANSPFDFMISERIEAWSGLMLYALKLNEMSGLYVTSNRSVWTYLVENSSTGEAVLDIENIPNKKDSTKEMQDWRDYLMKKIRKYTTEPWSDVKDERMDAPIKVETDRKISFSLYIIPGENPHQFFSRFCSRKLDDSNVYKDRCKIINTMLGLFEIQL